ncbi:MAG TPA: hypothetical protein VHN14_00950 [Kofleriaceae bacterium]|nr:hypothetical protein [Kofleriaceae bacterium]
MTQILWGPYQEHHIAVRHGVTGAPGIDIGAGLVRRDRRPRSRPDASATGASSAADVLGDVQQLPRAARRGHHHREQLTHEPGIGDGLAQHGAASST